MPWYAMDDHLDLDDHDIHGRTLFMFVVLLLGFLPFKMFWT